MAEFNIEDYLEDIVQEVEKRHQEAGDSSFESETHKELVRRVVGERLGRGAQFPLSTQTPSPMADNDDMGEKSYEKPQLKAQVDELVNTIFEKNIDAAIDKVKTQNNPALLDAFHDVLTDKLYEQLVNSGRLKQLR